MVLFERNLEPALFERKCRRNCDVNTNDFRDNEFNDLRHNTKLDRFVRYHSLCRPFYRGNN